MAGCIKSEARHLLWSLAQFHALAVQAYAVWFLAILLVPGTSRLNSQLWEDQQLR